MKIILGGFWRFISVWDSSFMATYLPFLRTALMRGRVERGEFSCVGVFAPFKRDNPIGVEVVSDTVELVEKYDRVAKGSRCVRATWHCRFGNRAEDWLITVWSKGLPRISGRLQGVRDHNQNVLPVLERDFPEVLLRNGVAHVVVDTIDEQHIVRGDPIYIYFMLKVAGIPFLQQAMTTECPNAATQIASNILAYVRSALHSTETTSAFVEEHDSQQFITEMDSKLRDAVSPTEWNHQSTSGISLDDWLRGRPTQSLAGML